MSGCLIGVISDTHGLIRPEALAVLRGVDLIFHAGDVGKAEVLRALEEIAPVVAVRGNCDRDDGCKWLPVCRSFEFGKHRFLIIHNIHELKNQLNSIDAIIFGHSHQAKLLVKDQILYLNPGSAGPKRFRLPVSVALIRVSQGVLSPEIIELDV